MDQPPSFPPPGEFGPPPEGYRPPSRWPRVLLLGTLALLVIGGVVLTVVLLAGGEEGTPGEGAPTDASAEDFCGAMREVDVVRGEVPSQATVDAYAEGLAETGTPEGIPGDARDGFELLVDALDELEVSGSPRSMVTALGSQLMTEEFFSFVRYSTATCG